jgi:hypothetical protein
VANPEHLEKLEEGVEAWNAWRKANLDVVPDLADAGLTCAHLESANLNDAHLENSNLCTEGVGLPIVSCAASRGKVSL